MKACAPIPAVDIRGGKCVQLVQGDFGRETTYADDPVEMARRWEAEGAERLHVVDLDGAREGVRGNAEIVRRLLQAVRIPVQVGGGVRTVDIAHSLLADGADRVILGTAAAEHVDQLADWVTTLGAEHVLVGVDARQGKVATHGWQTTSDLEATAFCRTLAAAGVQRVLYTDVERDGTLTGPNVETTRAVARELRVLASGGVSSVQHLCDLAAAGAEGAIIGTALYDGRLSLRAALEAAC
jgi:phosphoribosylformimino-5-aminoimidazole carboxamide ribotide isomerase